MLVHEYLKMLVITNHVLSYEYFCDELQDWELIWLLKNQHYAYKNEWEMTRYQLYYAIAPYTKNKSKSIQEFFPLSTDKEIKEEHKTEITNDEIEQLRKMAKQMEAKFKKEGQ
jgi:hypothetical protein